MAALKQSRSQAFNGMAVSTAATSGYVTPSDTLSEVLAVAPVDPDGRVIDQAGLVALPFVPGQFRANGWGSAAAPSVNVNAVFHANGDGTKTSMAISVASSATGANSASLQHEIVGDRYALRFDTSNAGNTNTGDLVGLTIDGVAYMVDPRGALDLKAGTAISTVYGLQTSDVYSDLGPGIAGRHTVEIHFLGNASATAVHRLFGYAAESRAGYVAPVRGANVGDSIIGFTAGSWNTNRPSLSGYSSAGFYRALIVNNAGSTVKGSASPTTTSIPVQTGAGALFQVGDVLNILGSQTVVTAISTDTLTVAPALPWTPPDKAPVNAYRTIKARFSSSDSTNVRWSETILAGMTASFPPQNNVPIYHAIDILVDGPGVTASFVEVN